MTLLWYILDTEIKETRLPTDRVKKNIDTIEELFPNKKLTSEEFESVIGLLSFGCSVVFPGRAFLRMRIKTTIDITKAYNRIRLNKEVKADLYAWLAFLKQFNGRSNFLTEIPINWNWCFRIYWIWDSGRRAPVLWDLEW